MPVTLLPRQPARLGRVAAAAGVLCTALCSLLGVFAVNCSKSVTAATDAVRALGPWPVVLVPIGGPWMTAPVLTTGCRRGRSCPCREAGATFFSPAWLYCGRHGGLEPLRAVAADAAAQARYW